MASFNLGVPGFRGRLSLSRTNVNLVLEFVHTAILNLVLAGIHKGQSLKGTAPTLREGVYTQL